MQTSDIVEKLRQVIGDATIEEFARSIDEQPQRVKDVLRQKQKPPTDLLIKLQIKLGVDLNWLLTDQAGPPRMTLSVREATLIDNYRAAAEEGRRAIEATGLAIAKSQAVNAPAAARKKAA
jgi:hypothetical protein